jgi:hypothetical protein
MSECYGLSNFLQAYEKPLLALLTNIFNNIIIDLMKWVIALLSIIIMISGCAVPFQNAEALKRGEKEFISGYSPPTNLSIRINLGVTGSTDAGVGLDIPIIPGLLVNGFLFGRQKILSVGSNCPLNLLVSGAYGVILASENAPPYYQYNALLGFNSAVPGGLITLGAGRLQDPRYAYDFMNSDFRQEVYNHIFFGVTSGKFMIQGQCIIRDMEHSEQNIFNIGVGIRDVK